ncbi:MAG TPA: winged helix-turn-helix domain-containing protein [Pyrinomonadaceae bacterium]|jgi:DNA-binding winged helix-turn-helix (wHTH) protein/TolB-like protein
MREINGEKSIYEFGEFRLDTGEKQLRRLSGEILPLPPKAFELLTFLVKNENRLLEKNELLDKVWADSFVEEGNLKINIYALRKTLNGSGEEFIETVPKRGYRFNADVKRLEKGELIIEKITESKLVIEKIETDEAENFPLLSTPAKTKNHWRYIFALGGILTIGALIYFTILKPKTASSNVFADYKPNVIAVLPFAYIGEKSGDSDFLQASLTDALTTRLGKLREIKIRPTSAVRRYAGQDFDANAVGKTLGADAVLEGTIRREGERVRVTAQLVRVSDQTILWTDSFNENSMSLMLLEDVIASRLSNALATNISPSEKARLSKRGTENEKAYNLYLQGRFYWNKRTTGDLQKSVSYFEQAISEDSNYSTAYAGLADAYLLLVEYGGIFPTEGFAKARNAAVKAIELDGELAEAHTSLGYIQAFYDWNFSESENSFRRAIELNPNYPTARQWFSEFLLTQGKFDEAFAELKIAEELDPTSLIIKTDFAGYFYCRREYDKAVEQSQKVIKIDSTFPYAYGFLWIAYNQKGMRTEAVETIFNLYKIYGYDADKLAAENAVFQKNGYRAFWQYEFDEAQNPNSKRFYNNYQRAIQALNLGDKEQIFIYLQKSFEARERWFLNLSTDPQWDEIRDDRRFTELLAKIKTQ